MLLALLITQAVMSVATEPRHEVPPPADLAQLSIVVADTVTETDPQPLCDRPGCLSLYRGSYANAVVLSGPPMSPEFTARVRMGSPFNMSYRIALIVEHREGMEPLVRSMAGFGDRSHEACFDWRDTQGWNWDIAGPRIVQHRQVICVTE